MASDATNAALASVQNYKQASSTDAIKNANTTYGVDESQARLSALKGITNNLSAAVEAVDPSVTGRTSGTFTTEGQRSALVGREQQPIVNSLNKANANYADEQSALSQKQVIASQMAQALLDDDQKRYQKLLDVYNASTARDQTEEQKRQFDVQQAESTRQFNAQQSANKIKADNDASKPNVNQFLVQAFSGYKPAYEGGQAYYTEREIIPALQAAYDISEAEAKKMAYDYRKRVFGEGFGR